MFIEYTGIIRQFFFRFLCRLSPDLILYLFRHLSSYFRFWFFDVFRLYLIYNIFGIAFRRITDWFFRNSRCILLVYFLIVFYRLFHDWPTTSSIFVFYFPRRVPLLILFSKILQHSIMNRPWYLYCIFLNLLSVKFFTTLLGIFFRHFLVYFLKIHSILILNALEDLFAFFHCLFTSYEFAEFFVGVSWLSRCETSRKATIGSLSILSFFIGCFKDIYTIIILCTSVISFGLL